MEKVDFTKGILAIQPDLHRFAYKLTADRDSANFGSGLCVASIG